MAREIRIVGGGLAGLTLGLLLRRNGVPVELWDAGSYPRSRVCGEFISGAGVRILGELGFQAAGVAARTVQFFDGNSSSAIMELPEKALAIDRASLDEALATEFLREGGILRERSRWTDSFEREGVVRATGRRLRKGGGMLGVKIHAKNISMASHLELHFSDEGYAGLSRLPFGGVNICALFRDGERFKKRGERVVDSVREVFCRGMTKALEERLEEACFEEDSFCAVAGISLSQERKNLSGECRIGDSICMIPPLTGNGMSIALETATLAAPRLREYCLGRTEWTKTVASISTECGKLLKRRLAAAGLMQRICRSQRGRAVFLKTIRMMPRVLNGCFWCTR